MEVCVCVGGGGFKQIQMIYPDRAMLFSIVIHVYKL